jgi:hypothetical protein
VAERAPKQGGEGVSLQTVAIAAIASGTAAVVTSYVWEKGTLISAAMTPVIVTILSELLKRPARTVSRGVKSARQTLFDREEVPLAHGSGAGSPEQGRGPSRELPARDPVPAMSEIKVYRAEGAGGRRFGRVHWKIVAATAGIAFVIAVGALTLPELLFGSSVSGSNDTTFFGGSTKNDTKTDTTKTSTEQKTVTEEKTTSTETATTPQRQTTTAPESTTPTNTSTTPTPPQAAPQTSTPQQQQTPQGQTTPTP